METLPPNLSETPSKQELRCVRRKHRFFACLFMGGIVIVSFIFGILGAWCAPFLKTIAENHMPQVIRSYVFPDQNAQKSPLQNTAFSSDDATLDTKESLIIDTIKQASPAVVSIVISQDVPKLQHIFNNPFGFPFFMMPQEGRGSQNGASSTEKQTVGQGSGFLASKDGLIVTNKHVVASASAEYTVITSDGKEYPAKVLARDPNRDIAILQIDAHNMPSLQMGDSDMLHVGQTVLAIGNSLGEFSNTVSKGIVSGLKRNLTASSGGGENERLANIIQTDAAINPGNSGGPLLDTSGKVIGVNVAMAEGAQSIGFALPINQVRKIVDQVQSTGKITTAFLGVRYLLLTPDIQKKHSLPLDHGALILRGETMTDFAVIPGSPADKAGLVENDIITEINGVAVDNDHQIADIVTDHQPGDTLSLTVWHKGETLTLQVTLEERQ